MPDNNPALESAGIFFDPGTGLVRNFAATPNIRKRTQSRTLQESPLTPVAEAVSIPTYALQPHGFVGVEFYDSLDEEVAAKVVATAGTVVVDVQSAVNCNVDAAGDPVFEVLAAGDTITAATPTTLSYGAPVSMVRATPDGLAGAVAYRLVVFTSET